jgi:hypothetical protein
MISQYFTDRLAGRRCSRVLSVDYVFDLAHNTKLARVVLPLRQHKGNVQLSHAGLKDVDRQAELKRPSRVSYAIC